MIMIRPVLFSTSSVSTFFRTMLATTLLVLAGMIAIQNAASAKDSPKLVFKAGDINHLAIKEELSIKMHFSQVDTEMALPSVRTTSYAFTETIDKVNADGSADASVVLDSFKTIITIGKGKGSEIFFQFNSADAYDMKNNFHDIRVLPRAQFLGHTLHFRLNPDGTVNHFTDLKEFHEGALGKGFDYDLVHAMISLSDSLRIGQLLEHTFGATAAFNDPNHLASTNYTVTEIPVRRTIKANEVKDGTYYFTTRYDSAPDKVEYLEGIATPLGLHDFQGTGAGSFTVRDGKFVRGVLEEKANLNLSVDPETVQEEIERSTTIIQTPIEVVRGLNVRVDTKEEHHGTVNYPKEIPVEPKK